jgi:hypothetical protein
MKVGMMKASVGTLVRIIFILAGLTSAVHALNFIAGPSDNPYSTSDGLNEFKMKMAYTLASIGALKDNSSSANYERRAEDFKANVSINNSSVANASAVGSSVVKSPNLEQASNSSSVNQSAENKTKGIRALNNSTLKSDPIPGGSAISQSSSISQSGIHFDNQASFNGSWSMQSRKQGFGSSGVNDRMTLSGNFNVQKSISFKE